jgi:uncharacterized membrane protein (UPF0127 family)
MKLWPVALVLVLGGCKGSEPKVEPTPPEPSPKQTSAQDLNQPKPVVAEDPDYISQRLYQLKDLATDEIEVGGKKIKVYLALNDSKRAEGMMHVLDRHINLEQGMIFAFPDEAPRQFWMQNTKIDLDLAYIAANGKIQSIHHMIALNENPVPGKGPAMYVLEMKRGAFKQLGIKEGMTVKIPPEIKSED